MEDTPTNPSAETTPESTTDTTPSSQVDDGGLAVLVTDSFGQTPGDTGDTPDPGEVTG